MSWTARREKQLRDDWAAGIPGSQIAVRLGIDRGAVSGKVRRLGLPTRREKIEKTDAPPPRPARPMPLGVTVPTIWKTLVDLEFGECRWPFGDRHFVFCALPADGAMPYCACHARLAYQGYQGRAA